MIPGVISSQQQQDAPAAAAVVATVYWDPLDKHGAIALDSLNRIASANETSDEGTGGSTYRTARGNVGRSSGRYYFECRPLNFAVAAEMAPIGLATLDQPLTDYIGGGSSGYRSWGYYCDGLLYRNNGGVSTDSKAIAVNEWVGIWVDFDAKTISVRDSTGFAFNSPLTGGVYSYTGALTYYPACTLFTPGDSAQINGGDEAFAYAVDNTVLPPYTYAWNGDILTAQPTVTWNSADKHADITLSGGDLIATQTTSGNPRNVRGTFAYNSGNAWTGKRYFEAQKNVSGNDALLAVIGVCRSGQSLTTLIGSAGGAGYGAALLANGDASEGGATTATGKPVAAAEWAGMAVDFATGKAWVRDSTGWVGDPEAGTGNSFTIPTAVDIYPCCGGGTTGDQITVNFGATAFQYAIPAGFEAWGA